MVSGLLRSLRSNRLNRLRLRAPAVLLIDAGIRKHLSYRDLRLAFILDVHRFNLLLREKRLESVSDLLPSVLLSNGCDKRMFCF
jgi:hypothetical protein